MKILVISDIHGKKEKINLIKVEAGKADLVIFGGDFCDITNPDSGDEILKELLHCNENLFAVIGNHDEIDFKDTLEQYDVSIEGSLSSFGGLLFTGSGGATPFSNDTPNERSEDCIVGDLKQVLSSDSGGGDRAWSNLVLVVHNPPFGTDCDKIPGDIHVGSKMLRSYIEEIKPVLVVTGHIHESQGISKIGETFVINPGALAAGEYAWVYISPDGKSKWNVEKIDLMKK